MKKINTWIFVTILFSIAVLKPTNGLSLFGIVRHDVPIERYEELGQHSKYDCVGRYSISEKSNDYAVGVLIDSKWVLTAAHFIQDASVWKFGDHFYETKGIVKHPALEPGAEETQWSACDLAIVELKNPVKDIEPAKRYYGKNELNKVITKIGYGYMGDGNIGLADPRVQVKLGGQNVIDAIGGTFEDREFTTSVMVCDFDSEESSEYNRFGSPLPLELEIGGSKGDSGGGIFIEENGQTFLAGIVSGALNRQIKYGAVMALARVSTANAWIYSTIGSK